MTEFFVIAIYVTFATLFCVFGIFAFGFTQSIAHRAERSQLRLIFLLLGFGVAFSNLATGRNLALVGKSIQELYVAQTPYSAIGEKLITLAIFFYCLCACFERIWHSAMQQRRTPDGRGGWSWVVLLFVLTNGFISGFFGEHPRASFGLLYPLPVLLLIVLDDRGGRQQLIVGLRNACLLIVYAGLLALVLRKDLVLEGGFKGALAFFPFRYWGALSHANALGGLSVLTAILMYAAPFQRTSFSIIGWSATLLSLLLSQSKTAILGMFAVVVVLVIYRVFKGLGSRSLSAMPVGRLFSMIALFLAIIIALVGAAVLGDKLFSDLEAQGKQGLSILTLSGRVSIWFEVIKDWQNNPIFGYGPDFLDVEHRLRLGMLFAFHAHNQFIQTLGQSGLVGLFGLLVFLGWAIYFSIKAAAETRGASIALMALILVRCLTEVPLRSGGLLSAEFVSLAAWVALVGPWRHNEKHAVVDRLNNAGPIVRTKSFDGGGGARC